MTSAVPDQPRVRRRALWAPGTTVVTAVVLALVAGAADGIRGSLSVWLGAAVVIAFFWAGAVPLFVVRGREGEPDRVGAAAGTALLLLTYTLRLAVAVAVLTVAGRSDTVLPRWTGLAVIGCALVWVIAQAAAVLRRDDAQ